MRDYRMPVITVAKRTEPKTDPETVPDTQESISSVQPKNELGGRLLSIIIEDSIGMKDKIG